MTVKISTRKSLLREKSLDQNPLMEMEVEFKRRQRRNQDNKRRNNKNDKLTL